MRVVELVPLPVAELHRDFLGRLLQVVVDGDVPIESPKRVFRLVEMETGRRLDAALPQRRNLVHHVKAAAVRRDHEIALFDRDVVHRRIRQVLPQ